jgi:hypothetical protein
MIQKKDEKLNLMHIAICRLLEPYGFYEFEVFDEDGWRIKVKRVTPPLKAGLSCFDERSHCQLFFGKNL